MDEQALQRLREEETRNVNIIRALEALKKTREFQAVKELVYDKLVEQLENNLKSEAKAQNINVENLYRIQGQLDIAKRYSLDSLVGTSKTKLEGIKKKQYE